MTKIELRNETEHIFKDISSERYREYNFANGRKLMIAPLYLHVSTSGGHRILDVDGTSYYIQVKEGWWIEWHAKDDSPHFVK